MSSTFPFKVPCCLKRHEERHTQTTHTYMWDDVKYTGHSCTGTYSKIQISANTRKQTTQRYTRSWFNIWMQTITVCACMCHFSKPPSSYVHESQPSDSVAKLHLGLINKIHTRTNTSLSFISTRPQICSGPMRRVLPLGFGNDCQSGSQWLCPTAKTRKTDEWPRGPCCTGANRA